MAIKFPTATYASLSSASFMDNVSKMAFFCVVRFDTVTTANKQYVFQHRLGTTGDQFSLRKDSTSDKFRFSVTAGGVAVTCDTTTVIAAGTTYYIGGNWERTVAGGMRLYLSGVADGTNPSTTTQIANYSTSGGTLYLSRDTGTQYGVATLEAFAIFPGLTLSAQDFASLSIGVHPLAIASVASSLAFHVPLEGFSLTQFREDSGNNRTVTSITGSVLDGGNLMTHQPYELWPAAGTQQGTVTAPPPNAWIDLSPDIFHAQGVANYTATIGGLTNGTPYQLKVVAIDAGGNVSADSLIVEITPTAPAPSVSTLIVPWRRDRNFSKFKPSQQG
jgi:hypothetical protein